MSGSSAGAEVKMRETAEERRKLESRFEKLQVSQLAPTWLR